MATDQGKASQEITGMEKAIRLVKYQVSTLKMAGLNHDAAILTDMVNILEAQKNEIRDESEDILKPSKWAKAYCPICGRGYEYLYEGHKPVTCSSYACLAAAKVRGLL